MPDNELTPRKNDEVILLKIDTLEKTIKGLSSSISRLFILVEKQGESWSALREEFHLCQMNGNHETEKVERDMNLINKTIVDNFQELSKRIGENAPETQQKKADADLQRKKERFEFAVGVIKMAALVLITLSVMSATVGILFYKKGVVDVKEDGRLTLTIQNTNQGGGK